MLAFRKSNSDKKILALFAKGAPKDAAVHAAAKEADKTEETIYKILAAFLSGGAAKSAGVSEKDVDRDELNAGEQAELEHMDKGNPYAALLARRIALDHLAEAKSWKDHRYYTRLAAMEKSAKA